MISGTGTGFNIVDKRPQVYLANAFANDWLPQAGRQIKIYGISLEQAKEVLLGPDRQREYDDDTVPVRLRAISIVESQDTCELYARLFWNGAYLNGKQIYPEVALNRVSIEPQNGDTIILGRVCAPQQLTEGIFRTKEEVLAAAIDWVRIDF